GTINRGIWQMKNGKPIHYTGATGLLHDEIGIIHCDSQDRLWIGYLTGGISCYQKGIFRHFTDHNGLMLASVYVIHEDKNNNIWIGAAGGIFFLPAGNLDSREIKTYLPGLAVSEIYEDQNGVYWIGTIKQGIKRYKLGQWFSFPQDDGLAGKEIYKILEDGRGNFWIGTQDGIIKIDKEELNAFAAGKIKRFQTPAFGLADGMKNTDCRPRSNNSAIKTRDGELWFGTRRGIAVVNSEKIYIDKYPPPLVIKEAIFNYESIPLEFSGKTFTGIKNILFYFTAPTFVSPARVKIMYRLEGYDPDWRAIAPFSLRRALYKNVPPGRYRFRVRACNSSGVWNNTGASFAFVLKPYFYQTLFFKMAACLVGMLLVIGCYVGLRKYLYYRKLKNKYKHSTLDPEKSEKYFKRLEHLVAVEKKFRDENLTLNSLAKQLAIAPRYLSQIVNERLNKNFRDYINEYRVKEAMQLLIDPGKSAATILETGLEVGFNSKEVFNRAFKKFTGATPSRYIKEHRAEAAQKKTRKDSV
ncbi:MAG: helix-turn-helix domain-containing protein, partial [Candidatus Aminicenantes bacterium]|nr:helix-turn-helix domain-containing protein [Candidatus Aminicenantes bacterium]